MSATGALPANTPQSGKRSAARRGKKPWRRDPAVLERLQAHARLARAGVPMRQIVAQQCISATTFWEDRRRLLQLAREAAGTTQFEQQIEADAWLRECIADADRETAQPGLPSAARTAAQANKRAAVDSWIRLWGIARPANLRIAGAADGSLAIQSDDPAIGAAVVAKIAEYAAIFRLLSGTDPIPPEQVVTIDGQRRADS